MSFKLETAVPDDVDRLIELHRLCYPLTDLSPEDQYRYFTDNPRCELEDVYVLKDGRELIASLIAYRFNQYQEEVPIPVIGIANVMVAPDRRRHGVAGFLISRALGLFEEEEIPASILFPFEHGFYRHLGWGYAGEVRQYHVETTQLLNSGNDEDDDDELSVRLFREEQLSQLMEFYDAVAVRSNGMLKRNEGYWREKIITVPRQVVLAYYSGEIIGYLIYSLNRIHETNHLAQEMQVHEWVAPTLDARDALLGFLAKQSDQVKRVKLMLPPDEPFHLWIDDARHWNRNFIQRLYSETATIALGWMYRLVNLKSAFQCGRRFNGVKGDLTVEMEDEILGDRCLKVNFEGGAVEIVETKLKSDRLISGPVDAISQMYCGYLSAQTAYEQDLLEFEGKDAIEFCQRAFSLPPPHCYDLF